MQDLIPTILTEPTEASSLPLDSLAVLDQLSPPYLSAYLPVAALPEVRRGSTILLVDDDDSLREVMSACLSVMGHCVVACGDAQSAAETFRSGLPIDILVTDLEMPGRNGMELARELTWLKPALPVMIVSGAFLTDAMSLEMLLRGWSFVPKPCRLEHLQASIATLVQIPGQDAA